MFEFAVIGAVVIVVILGIQIAHIVANYKLATGTKWQRFLSAFNDSLTVMWARAVQIVGALLTFTATLLPQLDPQTTLGATIQSLFNPEYAKYWLIGITALGALFEYVRRRPSSVDPITPTPEATK